MRTAVRSCTTPRTGHHGRTGAGAVPACNGHDAADRPASHAASDDVADRCPGQAVAPGASCRIDIVFSAPTYGDRVAVLHHFDELSPTGTGTNVIVTGIVDPPG